MEQQYKTVTARSGDTLIGIVKRAYGGYTTELLVRVAEASGLNDPNALRIGQEIRLPGNWGFTEPVKTEPPHTAEDITRLTNKGAVSNTPSAVEKPATLQKDLPSGDYWAQLFEKRYIWLHFTAGYTWDSAYATFKQPGRVATPFIVDARGPRYIVQLFDPKYWSYHLGCKETFDLDKHGIGIEIVNIGPVWRQPDGSFKDYVGKKWNTDDVTVGKNRGADGGVKFPVGQVEATCDLVNWLIQQFPKIPRKTPSDHMKCSVKGVLKAGGGVFAHQHVRADKYDMGTAWPWGTVIDRCGLSQFTL